MEEPTLSEIMRRLDDLNGRFEDLTIEFKSIPLRIDETYVRRDVYSADHLRLEQAMLGIMHRLEKMESRAEWTVRTVGGLVMSAVVSVAIYFGNNLPF